MRRDTFIRSGFASTVVAGAVAIWAAQGCSSLNTTAVQCLSEAECVARGPAFANTTCDPNTKTCVPVQAVQFACQTNQECIAANNNVPAICRHSDNTCVVLQTPECPTVIDYNAKNGPGDVANDDTVVLGAIGCQNVAFACVQWENELRLVQYQFAQAGGVPFGGKSHPVIWVSCNEFNVGPHGVDTPASHLINDIQAPIIAGMYDDGHAVTAMSDVLTPGGAFVIAPDNYETPLSQLPGNQFAPIPNFWRPVGGDLPYIAVAATAVSDNGPLQARYVAQGLGNPATSGGWKMLMIQENQIAGQYWGSIFLNHLTLNGKSIADCPNGPNCLLKDSAHFQQIAIDPPILNPGVSPDPIAAVSNAITTATQFKPNIIVYASENPYDVEYLVGPIEAAWPLSGTPLPLHISMCQGWPLTLPPIPFLTNRVFIAGTDIVANRTGVADRIANLTSQYNAFFNYPGGSPDDFARGAFAIHYSVYDSWYFAELLLGALGNNPPTPANVAQAALKFSSGGTAYTDEPDNIPKIFAALAAGQAVTIDGVSALLNWDPKLGAPLVDGNLQCVTDQLGFANNYNSNYKFSATTLQPYGTYDTTVCP